MHLSIVVATECSNEGFEDRGYSSSGGDVSLLGENWAESHFSNLNKSGHIERELLKPQGLRESQV